ncbi:MAG: hypothetical protein HYS34_01435 [Acidobacteria bacterium]|nr:hypothetical protein [Acidobacteriota bacterium]
MRPRVSLLAVMFLLGPGLRAAPAPPTAEDVAVLRREIEDLKRQIQNLRDQLRAGILPDQGPAPAPLAPAQPAPPPPAQPAAAVSGTAGNAPTRVQSLLNPAISAILLAAGTTSLKRESDANGFDLSEAEFAFQSAVDPFTRVDLFLSFPAGETPEVEEGFISTLALPGPLQLKGGRFKSAFGKWNGLHTHQFFSVDQANVLANFFGDESLTTDGLSLSVLIPNPWDQYIDLFTEVGSALEGTSFNSDRRNLTFLEHLAWFFNTGPNSTLEVGLTAARGRAGASEALLQTLDDCGAPCAGIEPRGELKSAVNGIDLTYKWKPVRLNVYRSFLWQTEALESRRHLDVLVDPPATPFLDPRVVEASGGYSHVEWQFAKRWRVGTRYDWSGFPDDDRARERAISGIVRFQPSEFQEIRLQYKRTSRNDDAALRFDGERDDSQLFFQWIPVIGAHGAHKY